MRQIRKGVFETNSSSVHAICIATDGVIQKSNNLALRFGEYGWDFERIDTPQEKLSYAITALFNAYEYDYDYVVEKYNIIREWFKDDDIKIEICWNCTPSDAVFGKTIWSCGDSYWHDCGELDHGCEAKEFVDYVFDSKDNMYNYLFNDRSYVLTGNDNDYCVPSIRETYPHETFVKGN